MWWGPSTFTFTWASSTTACIRTTQSGVLKSSSGPHCVWEAWPCWQLWHFSSWPGSWRDSYIQLVGQIEFLDRNVAQNDIQIHSICQLWKNTWTSLRPLLTLKILYSFFRDIHGLARDSVVCGVPGVRHALLLPAEVSSVGSWIRQITTHWIRRGRIPSSRKWLRGKQWCSRNCYLSEVLTI